MRCVLCHQPVDLFSLDVTFDAGPVHADCRPAYDAELERVLADAERLILDEHDRRRHRRRSST